MGKSPIEKPTPAKEKRIGQITFKSDLIRNDYETISALMLWLEFVPVRCEHFYAFSEMQLMGYSPKFRTVEHGMKAPKYIIQIQKDEDGSIDFELFEQDGFQ